MSLSIVYHPRFLEHRQAADWHPERPERLQAVAQRLKEEAFWNDIREPAAASREVIERAHSPQYLERLRTFGSGPWDADTYVRPETFEIARLAAGGAMLAAEIAWNERRPALALVRPPGHHATSDRAMGFCYLNNAAIAAHAHLAAGRGPVAIVDIDVHHGNGTQEMFYARPDVLVISLHQWPHYPGTGSEAEAGEGEGEGRTINLPLPAGCGDGIYAEAFERIVEPVLKQFGPTLLLVSLGTDAHVLDPLADMQLSTAGYLDLLARLRRAADALCEGRITFVLEGGYHLEATADVVAGLAAACAGRAFAPRLADNRNDAALGRRTLDRLVGHFARWWQIR